MDIFQREIVVRREFNEKFINVIEHSLSFSESNDLII